MRTHAMERNALVAGAAAMGLVVLVSNITVGYPINDWLTWGAFAYPLTFLVTDLTNRILGAASARRVVYVGFAVGVLLSVIFASPRIGIASGAAFLVAQLLDIWIFDRLRRQAWWKAPAVSSLIASALDTAVFFTAAFALTGEPWVTWALGDYAAKLAMAAVLLAPFRAVLSALPAEWRQPESSRA
ncbi:membrane protein [Thalassobaculum fulvum]|uniref:Probable queuosine precursor transporter n=1 Tax=Thalassobaculum fulvum TaxID=1633335 RepID=A0A919CNI1_9PROT|nr:queuosine precursor transporter [Thalassobaculum fulvum]GHD42152.1 membrane protein [Thalassobaculum fulvum]